MDVDSINDSESSYSTSPPELDLFALDSDDETVSTTTSSSTCMEFDSLDTAVDCYSLGKFIRGQSNKQRKVEEDSSADMRPIAYVRFNTRSGKPKPVTLKALLDSGGGGTLVSESFAKKLRVKSNRSQQVWTTPGGNMTTTSKVKAQFTLPELHDNRMIEWDVHVTKTLGAYDMIIGRDLLEFLGMDVRFSNLTVEWEGSSMPFKDLHASPLESYHINDPVSVEERATRVKRILDAKYEPADLESVCSKQTQLQRDQQQKLLTLLEKYSDLFDGTLGKWKGTEVDLELKEDAKPYHAKAYPVPRVHKDTVYNEVQRLVRIGVLKKVNRSEWAAPSFIIPKKDGRVRFISDFRELNKRIRRKPYPIPNIQEMLLNLEGFQYATSLDLNMGYYHLELSARSKEMCTIVFPFGKYEYQRIPMGLCNSPDIFQEKMSELMEGLEFALTYLDDLLCITKGTFDDHLEKLERVLVRLQQAGLKINADKSAFCQEQLEYLGYWITRDGIQPMKNKVEAIMNIAEPKNRRELRSFIGIVNYYRDMWIKRSHVLAPLAALTSKNVKWSWGPKQSAAFQMAKRIIAREVTLAYPDFTKPFQIHTDASHYQLGAVISQEGKPIAFYSRKLNDAQTRYTTTERELLSIVETLKEYRNILLGHEIEVFTDHKNLTFKQFNTERVMRWRLLVEEFGPKLTYIKGERNIVADFLSRMRLDPKDFSMDAFAGDPDTDFPDNYPLSYKEIQYRQHKDKDLQKRVKASPADYPTQEYRSSDKTYSLITHKDKIVLPKPLQKKATEWYHTHLLHQGETRMELTIGQHYWWKGMRRTITETCKACTVCRTHKARSKKYGELPPKAVVETIPWHTLCIDLIGPYKIGSGKHETVLHCMTMIDPATGWFEICEINDKAADEIANRLEFTWLTRYPWPTEIVMDRGKEFMAEVRDTLKNEYGISRKVITTRNPQANSIVERVHQVLHNMIRTIGIRDSRDLSDYGWTGVLSAVRQAMRSVVHTTMRATPTQLVFGRDALLNVSFEADWQYIKDRKQKLILQNNKRENATRIPHRYSAGDRVMVRRDPNRKHGSNQFKGPYTVTNVYDNGTVKLTRATPAGGAVFETWNIRNIDPCMA